MLDDYPDLLGSEWRFPRLAWDDQDPDRPIDERLALVALSARAAGLPPDVVLRAAPFVDRAAASLASGVIVREVRRGLAVAAQLIAEAPWETGPGLVTVTAEDGGPHESFPRRAGKAPTGTGSSATWQRRQPWG